MREPTIVTLGGVDYAVRPLSVGQVQRVVRLLKGPKDDVPFEFLKIALERADPRPAKTDEVEATGAEIGAAVVALMDANGFERMPSGEAKAPETGLASTAS